MSNDEYQSESKMVRHKQYTNLLIVAVSIVLLGLVIIYLMNGEDSSKKNKKLEDTIAFDNPIDSVNTQSIWMERAQNKLREQENKTEELKNDLLQMKNKDVNSSVEEDPKFQALQKQVEVLQGLIQDQQEKMGNRIGNDQSTGMVASGSGVLEMPGTEASGIDNDVINLKSINYSPKKNPDTFVPSGTYAEAIMLGAADASAGVQSQANPSPMLFRITANGTLPNHKTGHLKDCVVTAAVVGDISSERGQIRLERMSCTFPSGEIVDQPVEGTIFGMDAKNGVRGNPVWREGALLGRAAVAGTLSGMGSAVSQSYTTTSISPLGATNTVNNGEIFKYGAAQGASNAMDKLAEYNIRRAEQYHPVIQLSAGQPVDIVFLKGFYLDGRSHQEDSNNDNNKEAPAPLFPSSQQTANGLTLSEHEMQKIKQTERNMGWVKSPSGEMQ